MTEASWGITFLLVLATLGTVVLVVVIWQLFATQRARAALAREQEYRELAEVALETQREIRRQLDDLAVQFTEVRERLASLERILQQVE